MKTKTLQIPEKKFDTLVQAETVVMRAGLILFVIALNILSIILVAN